MPTWNPPPQKKNYKIVSGKTKPQLFFLENTHTPTTSQTIHMCGL